MKKIFIILIAACALFSFSCNRYCNCERTIDGVKDKDYVGRFVNEIGNCQDYNESKVVEGVQEEVKCK